MNSRNERIIGIGIVVTGILILLGKLGVFSFLGRNFWPLLVIFAGVILYVLCVNGQGPVLAFIPGGLLMVGGIVLCICNLWSWHLMVYLWPLFLLGLAVGIGGYAQNVSTRPQHLHRSSFILGIASLLLLGIRLLHTGFIYIIAVLCILGGVWLLRNKGTRPFW